MCEFTYLNDTPSTDRPSALEVHWPGANLPEHLEDHTHLNDLGSPYSRAGTERGGNASSEAHRIPGHEAPVIVLTPMTQPIVGPSYGFCTMCCSCSDGPYADGNEFCALCGHEFCDYCQVEKVSGLM